MSGGTTRAGSRLRDAVRTVTLRLCAHSRAANPRRPSRPRSPLPLSQGAKTKLQALAPQLAKSKAMAHILTACAAAQEEAELGAAALAAKFRASKDEVKTLPAVIIEVGDNTAGKLAMAMLVPAKNV